jgi:hypothetical protein
LGSIQRAALGDAACEHDDNGTCIRHFTMPLKSAITVPSERTHVRSNERRRQGLSASGRVLDMVMTRCSVGLTRHRESHRRMRARVRSSDAYRGQADILTLKDQVTRRLLLNDVGQDRDDLVHWQQPGEKRALDVGLGPVASRSDQP